MKSKEAYSHVGGIRSRCRWSAAYCLVLVADWLEAIAEGQTRYEPANAGICRVARSGSMQRRHMIVFAPPPQLSGCLRAYPDVAAGFTAPERHVEQIGDGDDIAIRYGRLVDVSLIARKLSGTGFVFAQARGYQIVIRVSGRTR
ncbi:hypothetical protein [Paraburkholderia silvatlantica]|uniref:hypothetical protein n=1 Tax=Paraburkholderia silvatlantica TaxID=321895 RepID=UPI00105D3CD1|nr:hypothetical protein [Paraburkholderia silvatlantica]